MDSSLQPNSTSTVFLAHASVQRLARQSATCKITSAVLSGAAMLLASGRMAGEGMLLATAPIVLLAFADASYAAKARGLVALANASTGKAPAWSDLLRQEVATGGITGAGQALAGIRSFTVWPFYTTLALLIAGLGTLQPAKVPTTAIPQPYMVQPGQAPTYSGPASAGYQARPGTAAYVPGPQPGANGQQPPQPNRVTHYPVTNSAVPIAPLPRLATGAGPQTGQPNVMNNRPPVPTGNSGAPAVANPSPGTAPAPAPATSQTKQ